MFESWEVIVRLIVATLLGGIIGLEREAHGRPAGLRTHILVCVGAALLMLVSMYGFLEAKARAENVNYDISRVAAQVVSGIGFLGAGTILREGATVRGLTTAASLWIVAGIGMAVGTGLYLAAFTATFLVMLTLMYLGRVEYRWLRPGMRTLTATIEDRPGQLAAISGVLGRHQVNIKAIDIEETAEGHVELRISVQAPVDETKAAQIVEEVKHLSGVVSVSYQD